MQNQLPIIREIHNGLAGIVVQSGSCHADTEAGKEGERSIRIRINQQIVLWPISPVYGLINILITFLINWDGWLLFCEKHARTRSIIIIVPFPNQFLQQLQLTSAADNERKPHGWSLLTC
jgi:hypothetical protein